MTRIDNVHYRMGIIFGKRYRLWYHRTHNKGYLWGIIKAFQEVVGK